MDNQRVTVILYRSQLVKNQGQYGQARAGVTGYCDTGHSHLCVTEITSSIQSVHMDELNIEDQHLIIRFNNNKEKMFLFHHL